MDTTDRPPMAEIGKRAAEAGAGLVAVAKAIATDDYATSQEAYQQRLRDDHAFGMELLGKKPEPTTPQEGEEMRRVIMVTGDVYGDEAVKALNKVANNPPPETPQTTGPPAKKAAGLLAKAAITAALLGTGAGIGGWGLWAMGMFNRPAVEQPETKPHEQNKYGISL